MNGSKIAQMKNERRKYLEQLSDTQIEQTNVNNRIKRLKDKIHVLDQKLKKREPKPVSDHAIVRYLERVKGIDIEDLIQDIIKRS